MSLGKDLASIRKSKHLTLEDIQNAIKIPASTIRSIEDDTIFSKSNESKTYIRGFIRSYGRHLGIKDEKIIKALDAYEEGNYHGDLLTDTESASEIRASFGETPAEDEETEMAPSSEDETSSIPEKPEESPTPSAPKKSKKIASPPDISSVNWADMGKKFNPGVQSRKMWLIIISFILVSLISIAAYVYFDEIVNLFESEPAEIINQEEPESAADTTSTELPPPATQDTSGTSATSIENQDTLTVAVYAAYGILDPVRVTSDFNWRTNPFWMEQGEAFYFDFRDSLLVRGRYNDLILMFNGHVIENPRQNYYQQEFNSIVITREILNQPKYLAEPPAQFPLDVPPPDSIIYRITY